MRCGRISPILLIGIESRGFLVAAPVAYELGRGFAMIRKQGKLPGKTVRHSYDLEYGSDTIEIQEDAFAAGPQRHGGPRSPVLPMRYGRISPIF